ncbi:MAG: formate dehydrogenase accessory sulfurtransferase FdhD [Candidatus Lokiarchaeota archaeon]|nr:formate dehydrogenase accessory sulfurtransferase FdhD [Candidatus Lokiarchaeota archaeon]
MIEELLEKFCITRIKNGVSKKENVNIISEYTLNINLNNKSITSLICLPKNLEELTIGYLISEGIIKNLNEITHIEKRLPNFFIQTEKKMDNLDQYLELRSSGCIGIKQTWNQQIKTVESSIKIDIKTIFTVQKIVNEKCVLWKISGGTHSAAAFKESGELIAFFEDVGRHNAVDKIIGHLYLKEIDPTNCLLVTTGRQSAGMVLKAIRAGFPIIISNTAPIVQGVELARKYNVTLICFAREPTFSIYSNEDRINL